MASVTPTDRMSITKNTTLQPGIYLVPNGITIDADNVTLDCNGAVLIGAKREGRGITCEGHSGVTIKGARLQDYYHGVYCKDCGGLTISGCHVTSTAEVEANTIFLDIMLPAEKAYGGGIMLWNVSDSKIEDNDLQHQMNGLLTYACGKIEVKRNNASYSSGYGIHLFGTCDSTFEDNYADYCCRWNKRAEAVGHEQVGHMGADATGFLIMMASCRNVFRRNFARMGGDGFFLGGMGPGPVKMGSNDNLFEENDASLSPNIAFEATFSGGNIFRNNYADRCNYGFWLGYSWLNVIENNRMVHNRQAGIAVGNGHGMIVRGNEFHSNLHGVLIWTTPAESVRKIFPDAMTSHHWTIEKNTFIRNGKGVRIAKDQDHGVRPLPKDQQGTDEQRPRDMVIKDNSFEDNRIGIELVQTDNTTIEGNTMNHNVEANIRLDDAAASVSRNNLGTAGPYL
jgi:parallel beta-helix repeat protein